MTTTFRNIGVVTPNGTHSVGRERTSILSNAGKFLTLLLPLWYTIRTLALTIVAGGCFVVAAWGVDWRIGLLVSGVWLLVLEHLSAPGAAESGP